ncbi:ABC transporter ATP-binding protein [Absiella sp. AM29-15]|uniref:ABC transporter ATP-binding protein n=1 Tax=Absiella sp. AM29-15 TaxID=2292278 RepID=UPI000E4251AB|nr:ABC transporter ATP-binding protein [Absiella sp. AM29-15]RGC52495.1 ABC transporter ATP-binding protein [Absiella sp. AM29-15]
MIDVKHVSVTLSNKKILQDISFQIPQGRILMVLGENGSGKTTLIKSMLQQLPYTGDILYQHQHISHMQEKERAKIFSYVPQIKELAMDMRVEDCIVAGCSRHLSIFEVPSNAQYEQVNALMEKFHLTHIKGKRLDEISGGELQMVYVARAFLQNACVMIMDEPCTYLDFKRQHMFLQETRRLCKEGKTIVLTIHDPNLALQYGDEIILLHKGKLKAHLKKETNDMEKECLRYYNELYGNHFTMSNMIEKGFLIWKE